MSFEQLIKFNKIDEKTAKFIEHNDSIIKKKKNQKSTSVVLVEFNGWQPFHICNSYLANILAEKYQSKIVAFENFRIFNKKSYFNIIENLRWYLSLLINTKTVKIYRSFGIDSFFKAGAKVSQLITTYILYKKIIKKIKRKEDIENITIYDVWVGDLIYDTYLKIFNKITIDINSKEFKSFLFKAISLFLFWFSYFQSKEVKALSVSHGVYTLAFPIRIAHKFDVPIYVSNEVKLIHLKKSCYSYEDRRTGYWMDFFDYKKRFFKLNDSEKKFALEAAENQIKMMVSGNWKDFYFKQSQYKNNQKVKYVNESMNPKILIASHTFNDSPHVWGSFFFSDFYEWFKFLEKIMIKTNYDWYVKPHPNATESEYDFLKKFVLNKKNVFLVPKNCSNLQLINEGIQYVLTVYGSIGSEVPYLGATVINASLNNPHIDFNFNINPKNLKEYEKFLLSLSDLPKKEIDKKEIYIYHFMRFFFYQNNYLLRNQNQRLDASFIFSNDLYLEWKNKFNFSRHKEIIKSIKNFVNSGDSLFSYEHNGKGLIESCEENNR